MITDFILGSNIIYVILFSVSAIIYLALGIYCFRLLKADWALGKKTEKESVLRLTIITATIGCICQIEESIAIALLFSGIIKEDKKSITFICLAFIPAIYFYFIVPIYC